LIVIETIEFVLRWLTEYWNCLREFTFDSGSSSEEESLIVLLSPINTIRRLWISNFEKELYNPPHPALFVGILKILT
jgi:hypothetical protein